MRDELATVLRLVAEGKLSPEEAAPIIQALTPATPPPPPPPGAPRPPEAGRSRRVRIQVTERGRTTVDLRVPLAFAAFAATAVPGIPDRYAALIEQAAESETTGTLVEAEDENGDGVRITVE